jgi:hypothetical protein
VLGEIVVFALLAALAVRAVTRAVLIVGDALERTRDRHRLSRAHRAAQLHRPPRRDLRAPK